MAKSGVDIKKFPFPKIRDGQKDVIEKLNTNWDKFNYFVMELPTG